MNNHTIYYDPNIISEYQPKLFDDLEAKMEEKTNIPKLESNIEEIRSILTLIYNTFSKKADSLNCFFTIGSKQNKICFHYLCSLPIIRFNLFKDGSSTIVFSSDWHGDQRFYDGWESIPDNPKARAGHIYKAKSVFVLQDVNAINVYEWGFEILNNDGIQLVAILTYVLANSNPEQLIGRAGWVPPFNHKLVAAPSFMKKVAVWNKDAT